MSRFLLSLVTMISLAGSVLAQEKSALTLVVMDPLAAPLSCPCVKGYAQRDYKKLAEHLELKLGRPVQIHFSESLTTALEKSSGKADIIIGKESVIRHESKANLIQAIPIASLTGKDGKTTMTGLFVIPNSDPALTIGDLKGYKLILGPENSDEKHLAALHLLDELQFPRPKKLDTCSACSDGAVKILELHKDGIKAVTVISSYAHPLLEGCGTIQKGDLRIVGQTEPVPFVVAFVNERLPQSDRDLLQSSLLQIGSEPNLCQALETKDGFVRLASIKKK